MKPYPLIAGVAIALTAQLFQASPALATTQTVDRQLTNMASQLLSDAGTARQALASGSPSLGAADITKALSERNKLAETARADGLTIVVPMYVELSDTSVIADTVKKNASKTFAMSSNHGGGHSAAAPMTVLANEGQRTYVAIDLDKAKGRLDAAETAVKDHNLQAAEDSLAAIGTDLIEINVHSDMPLLTAREDLSRAQRELASNDSAAAAADLHQASVSLNAYATGNHVKEARLLASEIDSTKPLKMHSNASTLTRIENWWSAAPRSQEIQSAVGRDDRRA